MPSRFYSGKDQFVTGVMIIMGAPFALPHVFLYGDRGAIWLWPIFLGIYVWILFFNYRFISLLFKQGREEKLYVLLVCLTTLVNFFYSLIEEHPFSPIIILIWLLFLAIFMSGKVYLKNITLAESLGVYNSKSKVLK